MERKGQGKTAVERSMDFEVNRTQKLLNKIEEELNEDRTPRITRMASSLERTEPVGDRLYKMAMESLSRRRRSYQNFENVVGDLGLV